jgi:hypothetical protein
MDIAVFRIFFIKESNICISAIDKLDTITSTAFVNPSGSTG